MHNQSSFSALFQQTDAPCIIAEIKFASPSRGVIYAGTPDPVAIAQQYLDNGAVALSILTESNRFFGSMEYLQQVRAAFPHAPILCKDFIRTQTHLMQAALAGANAVLLIAGFCDRILLNDLYQASLELGLTPLVEIHHLQDLEMCLALDPHLIGINNRNLQTLTIDLNTARELIQHIPSHITTICESGIESPLHIQSMQALGFDGFLIGTHFMRTAHPGQALGRLIRDCAGATNDAR